MKPKTLPRLVDHPTYKAASDEYQRYSAGLSKLRARISEIEALMASASPEDVHNEKVAAALRFAEGGGRVQAVHDISHLSQEHAEARTQAAAVQRAMEHAWRQMGVIQSELSAEICRSVEPDHRRLMGRLLETMEALDALSEEELELVRAIESAGYHSHFREYVRWPVLGMKRDVTSLVSMRLKEIRGYAVEGE